MQNVSPGLNLLTIPTDGDLDLLRPGNIRPSIWLNFFDIVLKKEKSFLEYKHKRDDVMRFLDLNVIT